jgi:HK97 family phage portal protein
MFKLRNLFKRKSAESIERKSNVVIGDIPIDSFLAFALNTTGRVSASQAMRFYRENSSVATAVDLIAESFEQIQPVLQLEDGKFIDEHEVLDLLNTPNGFQTWQGFGGQLSRHYLLKHDSHINALGNVNRPPIELFAIKPQNVNTQEDTRDSFPKMYLVPTGAGHGSYNRQESVRVARFYDGTLKELYHIMGFSSRSTNIEGDSPLEAAALETKQQIQGRVHNLSLLEKGGRLSLIVSFADTMNDDQHTERKKRINEQLSGAENAGNIAVISAKDMNIKEVGQNNKDMDFAELDRIAGQAIYLRYKIPLPLVTLDASTFNNMQTAITLLYDQAVLPHADTIFSGLSKMLLPRYKLDPNKIRITYNPDTITALMDRRLEQLEKRKKINIETINELRSQLPNREPIENGDILYQPATLVPVGEDLFTDDNLKVPGVDDVALDTDSGGE